MHLFHIPLPNSCHRRLAMREWFPEAVEGIWRSVAPSSTRHIGEVLIRTSGVCCRRMKHDPLLSNCNQHCQGHETCIEPEPTAKHVILQYEKALTVQRMLACLDCRSPAVAPWLRWNKRPQAPGVVAMHAPECDVAERALHRAGNILSCPWLQIVRPWSSRQR